MLTITDVGLQILQRSNVVKLYTTAVLFTPRRLQHVIRRSSHTIRELMRDKY